MIPVISLPIQGVVNEPRFARRRVSYVGYDHVDHAVEIGYAPRIPSSSPSTATQCGPPVDAPRVRP